MNTKVFKITTDKPTKLTLFMTSRGAPEHSVRLLCRSNELKTDHEIDFNDQAIFSNGDHITWSEIENSDIYIRAITETKQSILSQVCNVGMVGVDTATDIPEGFSLTQNFPNPFNPSTVLKFSIPTECTIALTIYSLTGQEIKTLVSGQVKPGNFKIVWNGNDCQGNKTGSGIYICMLKAGNVCCQRKIVLIR